MRLRILTSCKNKVKTSYKQDEGRKRLKVKESKRGRDKERKREREEETKGRREEETKRRKDERRKPFLCAIEGRDLCHLTVQPCCGKIECVEGKAISFLVKTLLVWRHAKLLGNVRSRLRKIVLTQWGLTAKLVPWCTQKGRRQKNIKRIRAPRARIHLSYLYVFQGYMHFLQTLHSWGLRIDNHRG